MRAPIATTGAARRWEALLQAWWMPRDVPGRGAGAVPARAVLGAPGGVEPAAADDHVGVAGVRVHRDQAPAAGVAGPGAGGGGGGGAVVHLPPRVHRDREPADRVQHVGHRARAVVAAV